MGFNDNMPMTVTKEALKIFLSSLPNGSEVEIVSFGSKYSYEELDGVKTFTYTNENLQKLLKAVSNMSANFGLTDILSPLEDIFSFKTEGHSCRRVFLLTDGQVNNKEKIFEAIKKKCADKVWMSN